MLITLTENERYRLDMQAVEYTGIARFIQAVRSGQNAKWIKPGPQNFDVPTSLMIQALRHNDGVMTLLNP